MTHMNFEEARFNMVEQQIRPWEVLDQHVLDTLMAVRREEFVPPQYRELAFAETQLPIGCGQTMLAPIIEGKVLQALATHRAGSVLEVGAGSGYFAALLATRADWVRSLEIEPELVNFATDNLNRAGVPNVIVEQGDGLQGWAERGPYDLIVLSGGVREVPQVLLEQLTPGGRLFAFVGEAPVMKGRLMVHIEDARFQVLDVFETLVPPLRTATPAAPAFQF